MQKRASSGFSAPQLGQTRMTASLVRPVRSSARSHLRRNANAATITTVGGRSSGLFRDGRQCLHEG